jgi:hypothetical protein
MTHKLIAVTPPTYALDGTRGYQLTVDAVTTVRNTAGEHTVTTRLYGWVDRTADNRVIATLDSYPWEYVTSEPVAQWSRAWVREHATDILSIYGWSV